MNVNICKKAEYFAFTFFFSFSLDIPTPQSKSHHAWRKPQITKAIAERICSHAEICNFARFCSVAIIHSELIKVLVLGGGAKNSQECTFKWAEDTKNEKNKAGEKCTSVFQTNFSSQNFGYTLENRKRP